MLRWREKRFALRFAFRVKPRDRFVFQSVKVALTRRVETAWACVATRQIARPVPFTKAKTAST